MGRFSYSLDVGEELEKEEEVNNVEKGDISIKEVTHDEVEVARDGIVHMEKSAPPKESFILTKADLEKKKTSKKEKKAKKEEKKAEKKEKLEKKTKRKEEKSLFEAEKEEIPEKPEKIRLKKYDDSLLEKLKRWQAPLFLAIVLIIGMMVLSQPASLEFVGAEAEKVFTESEQAKIINSVILEFPYMSAVEKDKLARDRIMYMFDDPGFKEELAGYVEKVKNKYKTPGGEVYLLGADSHYYFRQATNLFEYGSLGDKIVDGVNIDSYRIAPHGAGIVPSLLPYAMFYFHNAWSFFGNDSLLKSAFYLPLVIGLLSIIAIFFIGKKLSSDIGGFFAALLLALHPRFFISNAAGWADTNAFNMLFSLVIVLLFLHLMDFKENPKSKNVIYLILLVAAVFLFRFTWTGYSYIIAVIALFLAVYGIYYLVNEKKNRAKNLKIGGIIAVIVLVVAYLFRDSSFVERVLSRLNLLQEVMIYPSSLPVISELQRSSFVHMIDALGGPAICLMAFAGFVYSVYRIYKKKEDTKNLLFVLSWLIPLLIAGYFARRFIYYLVPVFCVLVAISAYHAYPYIIKFTRQINLALDMKYLKPLAVLVISLALFFTLSNDLGIANNIFPFMNDGVSFTSVYLRDNTPPDAVVNMWWDSGYIYEHYAERGFIMDNGHFSGMRLYLFSRALMTDDEYLARDLLKIIDCGIDEGFFSEEELRMLSNEELDAVARERVNCTAPPAYLIVSEEDYMRVGVLNAFATWNFRKRFMAKDIEGMEAGEAIAFLVENYDISEDEAQEEYMEIDFEEIEGVKFSKIAECGEIQGLIACKNGFIINGTDARANGNHPDKLYLYEGGEKQVIDYEDTKSDLSLVLFVTKKGYRSIVVGEKLADSVLVRALAGEKFDGMEMVYQVTSPSQINTYKID